MMRFVAAVFLVVQVVSARQCSQPDAAVGRGCASGVARIPLPMPSIRDADVHRVFRNRYMLRYPEGSQSASQFGVCYAREARKALFSVHALEREAVEGECKRRRCRRPEYFGRDRRICSAEQDRAQWYSGSGLDRGHLVPNAAFGQHALRNATFRVTNIVPQTSDRNRNVWNQLEQDLRDMVTTGADTRGATFDAIYVYTAMAYTLGDAFQEPLYYERSRKRMYYPLFIYKVAVCVDSGRRRAVMMACPSDNFKPPRRSTATTFNSPTGSHILKCPEESYRARCVPLQAASCKSLSDECFQANQRQWTVETLLDQGGLDWAPVERGVRSQWQLQENDTCFSYLDARQKRDFCQATALRRSPRQRNVGNNDKMTLNSALCGVLVVLSIFYR